MSTVLVLFAILAIAAGQQKFPLYDDYKNHYCNRDCTRSSTKLICTYNFTIEWLFTLEPACKACLNSPNDCPECIKADGVEKLIMAYNRMMPGPGIHVCKDDTIIVNLRNNLGDATTSIHWHGMLQQNTQYMDGVPMITQCGVHPYTTFQYRFKATEVGTHFYHSHSSMQRCEGAFGALIVHKRIAELVPAYDLPEHVILLNDWYFHTAHHHMTKDDRYRMIDGVVVANILINGVGTNGSRHSLPPRQFEVVQGSRYRFRIIHTGCKSCDMELAIQGHRLTIVASDGNDILPITVDTLTLMNGERYDFILEANRPIKNYVIRVQGGIYCEDRIAYAVLKYQNARNLSVNLAGFSSLPAEPVQMNCINMARNSFCYNYDNMTHLSPTGNFHSNSALYYDVDYKYYVGFDIKNYARKFVRGPGQEDAYAAMINNIFMTMPTSPLLQHPNQSMCNYENLRFNNVPNAKPGDCSGGSCECVHGIDIRLNTLVELILVDEGTIETNHPLHLHGYQFIVLAQQKVGPNVTIDAVKKLDRKGMIVRNFNSPIVKDTVSVPSGGYLILRFMANNPGYWLMHCHVDFHVEMGMQMVIKTGDPPAIPSNFPKCGNYIAPAPRTSWSWS